MIFATGRAELLRARVLLAGSAACRLGAPEATRAEAIPGARVLREAGMTRAEGHRMIRWLGAAALSVVGAGVVTGVPMLLLLLPLLVLISWRCLERRAFRRAESFERDYTALLISLSSGIRTGLDPLVALGQSGELFPSTAIIRGELARVRAALDQGGREDEVILGFARDIRHPDIQLFRTAFILARREGSSLAECLHRLARVTRQRQSFRRKIRGAVAMQRLSAFGIGGCALLIGAFQIVTNSSAVAAALEHPVGTRLLGLGLMLILGGLAWMLHLTRVRL